MSDLSDRTLMVPSGRKNYVRSYETVQDATHNASLSPGQQRKRSWSMGTMDASGNRTGRSHYHGYQDSSGQLTGAYASSVKPNAGPHSDMDLASSDRTLSDIMVPKVLPASSFPSLADALGKK